ncbi:GTPase Era [Labilibaculum sp. DW002]|uniref:GTPase Era n=1 Tax=Paralabilibaculum antarcticum TaxID=2912572 RepID=A0ABT5VY73_9BACT|nr:GTPase Era [Labilibaculum sp. DW002]MDE5420356.1 GTPase Era [Labilibaculum sp. DW002]
MNKIDLTNQDKLVEMVEVWKEKLPKAEICPMSAKENFNVSNLFSRILELLPEAPPYFAKDEVTDLPSRFFVTEIIREKVLMNYDKEVPYSVEVEVEEYKDEPKIIRIMAVINVERSSQKGIIIGHKGAALKKVGTDARKDIEAFFGKKVFLQLYVKVAKDWRSKDSKLKGFGY